MHQDDISEDPIVIRASDITPTSVDWMLPGFVPFGMVSRLDGDPGIGKSTVMMDLAARCSIADEMPDETVPLDDPVNVLVLSAEDGPGDLQRRAMAAGADTERVNIVTSDEIVFPEYADWIEETIIGLKVRLAIIDPFMSYLSPRLDSHRDHSVRQAMRPLRGVAERTRAAIVLVGHLNKSQGKVAKYRTVGSIGLLSTCRVALLSAADPTLPGHSVLAVNKTNLDLSRNARRFRVISDDQTGAGRIEWGESLPLSSDDLLAGRPIAPQSAAAQQLLLELLAEGGVPAKEVIEEGRRRGVSQRTIKAAKASLGVTSRRVDASDAHYYVWELPHRPVTTSDENVADLNGAQPEKATLRVAKRQPRKAKGIQ